MAKVQKLSPEPLSKVNVNDYAPDYKGEWTKDNARKETKRLQEKMYMLQEKMYAQGKYALLVILQAMDAGGKDSTIKKVFSGINPQGFRINSFKVPTPEELSHDFLWRIHQHVPEKGYIGIFNRSHYEDVLVVRVNNLVPESIWRKRYDHINNFERRLADSGVYILKFFLHISKEEQRERFQDRLDDPTKHWKFSRGDLEVRKQWAQYMRAYGDAITFCNTDYAPWHIVPANRKWYRNYVITRTIVETMEAMPLAYPEAEKDLDKIVIPED